MNQLSSNYQKPLRRLSPTSVVLSAEKEQHHAKSLELGTLARKVFEQLRPQLIEKYENWFIAIKPLTEDYLIEPNLETLLQKVQTWDEKASGEVTIFRLNETGACGNI